MQLEVRKFAWFTFLFLNAVRFVSADPIRLHPENSRYFEYEGKPMVLVTSAEHYGALINLDFDYVRYFETLQSEGMNYTRIFMGAYVETPSSFGIRENTLAPKSMKLIMPWKRSDTPGYANGGNKFDLMQWDDAYFERLRDFMKQAAERHIIVEITPFSSIYKDEYWEFSPFHPDNNINEIQAPDRKTVQTLPATDHNLLVHQERYVRKLVEELNEFDNFFFEIQNEPWSDNQVEVMDLLPQNKSDKKKWTSYVHTASQGSLDWQRHFSLLIWDEESKLPKQHLIAQNFCNFKYPVTDVPEEISIINFHYAWPEAAYWNMGWDRVVGFDESGFRGPEDEAYRKQAWHFMMAGGGLFNNLDYSFVAGFEDGTFEHQGPEGGSPGGGSKALRKQLKFLKDFIHGFDFIDMAPDQNLIRHAPGVFARGLAQEGKQYAVYVEGEGPVELILDAPRGNYDVEWFDPKTGSSISEEKVRASKEGLSLFSPWFTDDAAVRISR